MNRNHRTYSNAIVSFVCMCFSIGCDFKPSASISSPQAAASTPKSTAAPLATYQRDLLALAYETASVIPEDPHIKDKCRAQEAVVSACLQLNQPNIARRYAEGIQDWRRGTALAEVAQYCAKTGDTATAESLLALAAEVVPNTSEWRRDRVRVAIASTYLILGQSAKADEFASGTEPAEAGKLDVARASIADHNTLEQQLAVVERVAESQDVDQLRHALDACAELFSRFYKDESLRSRVEQKLVSSWESLPSNVRLDLMAEMAEVALKHSDKKKALSILLDARELIASRAWPGEIGIPLAARLAGLRYRAGETEQATNDVFAALAWYLEQRELILNIDRAGILRAIAEAHQAMGDSIHALKTFDLAVDAGVENPNSRPRSQDLSATCASMACAGVEPSVELWSRLRQIKSELGHPW